MDCVPFITQASIQFYCTYFPSLNETLGSTEGANSTANRESALHVFDTLLTVRHLTRRNPLH